MRRWLLVTLLLVPGVGLGQEDVARRTCIRGVQFPERVVFLVDRSGSMDGDRYSHAVEETRRLASFVDDGSKIRFFTFSESIAAEPQGWISVPDKQGLDSAISYLRGQHPAGNTDLLGAMRTVLALPGSPLGVIIVTDGDPDGEFADVAAGIAEANKARGKEAVIGILCVLPQGPTPDRFCRFVARDGGGDYVKVVPRTATGTALPSPR